MSSSVVQHGLSMASAVSVLQKVLLLVSKLLNHLIFHPLRQNPVAEFPCTTVNHLFTFLGGSTSLFSIYHRSILSHLYLTGIVLSSSLFPLVFPLLCLLSPQI